MGYDDLLRSTDSPDRFVRLALARLEADFRHLALLALAAWDATGVAAPDLFPAIANLQRPAWGTWNGLLHAIRGARRRVLRGSDADDRRALESSAALAAILARLDDRIGPAGVEASSPLATRVRAVVKERTRVQALLELPIALRNRVVHDEPRTGEAWAEIADDLRPLVGWHAAQDPLGSTLEADHPAPWFLERDGLRRTFNGLTPDFAVVYVGRDGVATYDESQAHAVLLAFQRLLGRTGVQERDFRRLLARLAPDEMKGVLLGDYLVGPPVGEGGFGRVHVARQLSTGRQVAVKILFDGTPAEMRQRFDQEARHLARFHHPHIVAVYEHGEATWSAPRTHGLSDEPWYRDTFRGTAPVKHYIAMEWVEGRTLDAVYREGAAAECDPRETAGWFADAAGALAAVHAAGLIHRDVKPGNLMLTVDGDVKLMDFGIARSQTEERTIQTCTGRALGTPAYMSPEQIRAIDADDAVGPATDLYSLCATFYELLAGARLFGHDLESGDTVRTRKLEGVRPERPRLEGRRLPWEIDALVLGGLEAEIQDRPTSMEDLESDLRRFLEDEPIRYRRPSWPRRLRLAYRRNRTTSNLVAAFVVAGVIGILLYVQGLKAEQARTHAQHTLAVDRLARVYVRSGTACLEAGDEAGALVWFAEALEAVRGDAARERAHRVRVGSLLGGSDRVLDVLRVHTPRVVEPLRPAAARLTPDGRRLVVLLATAPNATGGQVPAQWRLSVWDLATETEVARTEGESILYPEFSLAFLPDGRYVVAFDAEDDTDPDGDDTPGADDYLLALDLEAGTAIEDAATRLELLALARAAGPSPPPSVSPGARYVRLVGDLAVVRERPAAPPDVATVHLPGRGVGLAFDPAGDVVTVSRERRPSGLGRIHLARFDAETLEPRGELRSWEGQAIEATLCPGVACVVLVSHDLPEDAEPVDLPAVPPDEEDYDLEPTVPARVRRVDLETGEVTGTWILPLAPRAVSPDGRHAVCVWPTEGMYGPRHVFVYDLLDDRWLELEGPAQYGSVEAITFAPVGERFVTRIVYPRGHGGGMRVYDPAAGRFVELAAEAVLRTVAPSADASLLAASYAGGPEMRFGLARIRRVDEPDSEGILLPHAFEVARFTADGGRVATAEGVRTRLWRTADAVPLSSWLTHPFVSHPPVPVEEGDFVPEPWVYDLVFTASGERLLTAAGDVSAGSRDRRASASSSSSVVVWSVTSGEILSRPFVHGGRVRAILTTPAGEACFTAGDDGRVRRIDLRPAEGEIPDILRQVELVTHRRIDDSETLVDLTDEALLERYREAQGR